jgi:hypothetical protein
MEAAFDDTRNIPATTADREFPNVDLPSECRSADWRCMCGDAEAGLGQQADAERRTGHDMLSTHPTESGQCAQRRGWRFATGGLRSVCGEGSTDDKYPR